MGDDDMIPSGAILHFGGTVAPTGYLLCDGSAVSRTTYAALFAAIGIAFGAGDTITTFNVPDIRGRSPVGTGNGAGLTARAIAASGGEETHPLVLAENAPHTHTIATQNSTTFQLGANQTGKISGAGDATGSSGVGTAHNTMHPFLVVTGIIKT